MLVSPIPFQNLQSTIPIQPTNPVVVGDFNNNGKLDLAVIAEDTALVFGVETVLIGHVNILLGQGDGTFGQAAAYDVGHAPASVAMGDFNNDGKLDLAVANFGDHSMSILLGQGNGAFIPDPKSSTVIAGSGAGPLMLAVGDFNGDKISDLVVNLGSFGFRILPGPL